MMEFKDFHHALRILLNIDADEFIGAMYPEHDGSPIHAGDIKWIEWHDFRDAPHMWFIKAPTAQAEAVWKIVEGRLNRVPSG